MNLIRTVLVVGVGALIAKCVNDSDPNNASCISVVDTGTNPIQNRASQLSYSNPLRQSLPVSQNPPVSAEFSTRVENRISTDPAIQDRYTRYFSNQASQCLRSLIAQTGLTIPSSVTQPFQLSIYDRSRQIDGNNLPSGFAIGSSVFLSALTTFAERVDTLPLEDRQYVETHCVDNLVAHEYAHWLRPFTITNRFRNYPYTKVFEEGLATYLASRASQSPSVPYLWRQDLDLQAIQTHSRAFNECVQTEPFYYNCISRHQEDLQSNRILLPDGSSRVWWLRENVEGVRGNNSLESVSGADFDSFLSMSGGGFNVLQIRPDQTVFTPIDDGVYAFIPNFSAVASDQLATSARFYLLTKRPLAALGHFECLSDRVLRFGAFTTYPQSNPAALEEVYGTLVQSSPYQIRPNGVGTVDEPSYYTGACFWKNLEVRYGSTALLSAIRSLEIFSFQNQNNKFEDGIDLSQLISSFIPGSHPEEIIRSARQVNIPSEWLSTRDVIPVCR